jgi:hypothetical protein
VRPSPLKISNVVRSLELERTAQAGSLGVLVALKFLMDGQLIQEIRYRLDFFLCFFPSWTNVSLGLWYIWYLNDDTDWTGGMAVSGRC